MDCPPKKMAILERWPLNGGSRLYLDFFFQVTVTEKSSFSHNHQAQSLSEEEESWNEVTNNSISYKCLLTELQQHTLYFQLCKGDLGGMNRKMPVYSQLSRAHP